MYYMFGYKPANTLQVEASRHSILAHIFLMPAPHLWRSNIPAMLGGEYWAYLAEAMARMYDEDIIALPVVIAMLRDYVMSCNEGFTYTFNNG